MLDMLLVTHGESCRSFEFAIGFDLPNPFEAAQELLTPPLLVAQAGEMPAAGPAGWFFHLDARNVVLTSVAPLGAGRWGVRLRAFESAGRYTRAQLRCPRTVVAARMTDFQGQRLATLDAQSDTVPLHLAPHEYSQIEIEFA